MKKIIVTGSCGFIGYNLINSLPSEYEIIGIDSLNNAYDSNLKNLRLEKLNQLSNFKFLKLNFSDFNEIEMNSNVFNNCDSIVHLGARAGVRQSFSDPEKYLMDNTLGTTNLSLQVKEKEIPKFIIASTSSIYGDTGDKVAIENKDELMHPPSVYASTKYFGEVLAKNILEKSDTIIQIPRFFTVYGPFGRPDMSILRFIHWIQTEQEVIIYGDGDQRRSFTYIDDIIDGIIKLMNYEHSGTFNFGSNETWSLNDVIGFIEDSVGKKAKTKFKERAFKDVDVVLPSLDLSNDILEWKPSTNIKIGIDKTVEWYLSHEKHMKNIKYKYDYEK